MFSMRRMAQIAAWFATSNGGRIERHALGSLVYLADRKSMDRHGQPITYDTHERTEHGPVQVRTRREIEATGCEEWAAWMKGRYVHEFEARRLANVRQELDELSEADLATIRDVWNEHGGRRGKELARIISEQCPEWGNTADGPIRDIEILYGLGWLEEDAKEAAAAIDEQHRIEQVFKRAKER